MNWETKNTVNTLKIIMDLSLTLLSYNEQNLRNSEYCDHTENHNESSDIKKANTTLAVVFSKQSYSNESVISNYEMEGPKI